MVIVIWQKAEVWNKKYKSAFPQAHIFTVLHQSQSQPWLL